MVSDSEENGSDRKTSGDVKRGLPKTGKATHLKAKDNNKCLLNSQKQIKSSLAFSSSIFFIYCQKLLN